jgi:hypothetical protein
MSQEEPNLGKCDQFSSLLKQSGSTEKPGWTAIDGDTQEACASLSIQNSQPSTGWDTDAGLERILHHDLLILDKSRKLGMSQTWIDHGGKYLMGAKPTKPGSADTAVVRRCRIRHEKKHKMVTDAKSCPSHKPITQIPKTRQCLRPKRLTKHNKTASHEPAICVVPSQSDRRQKHERARRPRKAIRRTAASGPPDNDCLTSQGRSVTIAGPSDSILV